MEVTVDVGKYEAEVEALSMEELRQRLLEIRVKSATASKKSAQKTAQKKRAETASRKETESYAASLPATDARYTSLLDQIKAETRERLKAERKAERARLAEAVALASF